MSFPAEVSSEIARCVEIAANCIDALGTFDPTDPRYDHDFGEALDCISRARRLLHRALASLDNADPRRKRLQTLLHCFDLPLTYLGLRVDPTWGYVSFPGSYRDLWEASVSYPEFLSEQLRRTVQEWLGGELEVTCDQQAQAPVSATPNLNDTEGNILEALGGDTMTGEELAKQAGYPFNSNFRSTLSRLVSRGILVNLKPGYRRTY
jgi:hypothetical protein